jgi:hypothetical protein
VRPSIKFLARHWSKLTSKISPLLLALFRTREGVFSTILLNITPTRPVLAKTHIHIRSRRRETQGYREREKEFTRILSKNIGFWPVLHQFYIFKYILLRVWLFWGRSLDVGSDDLPPILSKFKPKCVLLIPSEGLSMSLVRPIFQGAAVSAQRFKDISLGPFWTQEDLVELSSFFQLVL